MVDPFPIVGGLSNFPTNGRNSGLAGLNPRSEPNRLFYPSDFTMFSGEYRSMRSQHRKVANLGFDRRNPTTALPHARLFGAERTSRNGPDVLTRVDWPRSVPSIASVPVTTMLNTAVDLSDLLARDLKRHYGPYVPMSTAWRWLSFSSLDAARSAWRRGTTPVPCVRLKHRRGLFIAVQPLAAWLYAQGLNDFGSLAPHPGRRVVP